MNEDRVSIYVEQLSDLSERQIQFAFVKALRECRFIPQISELRQFAADGALELQRADAINRTRALLDRPDKPDDDMDWGPDRASRALIAKRIILESKASGKWGPEAVAPALAGLAAMDRGEPVSVAASLGDAIAEAFGPTTREPGCSPLEDL